MAKYLIFFISLTAYSQNEMFRGAMYVKTLEKCELQVVRIGAYDDKLIMMLDKEILQFENCLHNEDAKLTDADYLCRDKCGTNYQIKIIVENNYGFIFFINNLLKPEKTITISTANICK